MKAAPYLPASIRRRPGFTLIELLIVIAIILILMGLVAAGIFKAIEGQEKANTEQTIRKVMGTLKQQWEYVVNQARNEVPLPATYQKILNLANGDPKRARVIWIKLRLKQNFPTSFLEAKAPYQNNDGSPGSPLSMTDLPGLYTTPLQNVASSVPAGPAESSVCLLLALQRQRGGVKLNMDDLGSTVVTTVLQDNKLNPLKGIVDAWGTPLKFYRFPIDDARYGAKFDGGVFNGELDASNPAVAGSLASKNRDPLDPDGLLQSSPTVWTNNMLFQNVVHPLILTKDPNGQIIIKSVYTVPVIVSAGPDKTFSNTNDDDIFSFRLRTGARGD